MKAILLMVVTLLSLKAMSAQTDNGEYKLDKAHAHIGFEVSHLGFSMVVGRFNKFDGKAVFEADGESSVEFTVEAKSIDTNSKLRDKHLRNDDFFDTETFPIIEFKSTSIVYDKSGDPLTITGDLNLHGVTKPVIFSVTPIGAGTFKKKSKAGYKAITTIVRQDFEMDSFAGVVGDNVDITVNIELQKK